MKIEQLLEVIHNLEKRIEFLESENKKLKNTQKDVDKLFSNLQNEIQNHVKHQTFKKDPYGNYKKL